MSIKSDYPIRLRLPGIFMGDHLDRFGQGIIVLSRGRVWTVRLSRPALANLADDARYYAHDVDMAPAGIVASARRTVAAIERQGVAR